MLPARRIPRFLKVHPEVDQISKNLDMALWLHVASHHAKTQPSRNSGGTSFRNGRYSAVRNPILCLPWQPANQCDG